MAVFSWGLGVENLQIADFAALSWDVKQQRRYVDQPPVRAAIHGRILVLES